MYEKNYICKENLTEEMIENYRQWAKEEGLVLVDCNENEYLMANIAEEKIEKLEALKNARDKAETMPVMTDKGIFDVDEMSILRINTAIIATDVSKQKVEWTLADNSKVMVDADDLRNVILALAVQSSEVHNKYRNLADIVEQAENYEDFINIKWYD